MKSERGQSFIELGISMTFLLILLAGVMDLGRVIFTYIALRDAVQEGAAYVAMSPDDCDGAIERIRGHTEGAVDLSDDDPDDPDNLIDVTIKINGVACNELSSTALDNLCPGDQVEVVANYNEFVIATPFVGGIVGGQSIDFETQVIDSIIVDFRPGVGTICLP